jgi:DNA-binding SARP family transcriptional activator
MVTLRLLGGIDLTGPSGEEVLQLLSQPKRMAVLAYLAIAGHGKYLRRDRLMALFWAESDISHARNALNQVLHALRSELEDGVLRTRGKHELGLDPERFQCDVWAFLDAVHNGRNEEALEFYAGPLLPSFHLDGGGEFERWLEEEREGLREAAAGAAWSLAHEHIRRGALVDAERTAQRALGLVWSDETPVRNFIAALAAAGDRAAAMRFYRKFCARLKEELDVEPSAPTVEVAESIRNGNGNAEGLFANRGPNPGGAWAEKEEVGFTPSTPGPVLEGTSVGTPPPDQGRSGWRGWWWTGGAVAAALTLVYLPGLRSPPPVGPPPPDRPFTVLAGVQGNADPDVRELVGFLLQNGLDAAHVVQTVPLTEVARVLGLMERGPGAPLDPALAREVAVRLGVGTVVLPRFDRLGESYVLALRVEEVGRGRHLADAGGTTEGAAKVVELVDDVSREIRRKLGETRAILAASEPLPQVLTPSLEALQEYRQAREAGPGQARDAVTHLRRAVAADTAFAMAWQLMASFYGNYLNEPDSAELASRQVQRFRDRLTEARRSDLLLHRRIRRDVALWDVALEEAEAAVLRDPRFLNNYGVYTAAPGGLPDSALNIRLRLERDGAANARRFNPDLPYEARCFINTHYMAAALDRMDEFYGLLDSMDIRLPPDCGREVALFESLAAGEWDRVDSMVQHGPGDWRWPTAVEAALLQIVPLRGGIRAAHTVSSMKRPETKGFRPDSSELGNIAHLLLQLAYDLPLEEAPEETFGRRGEPKALEARGRNEVTDFVLYGVRESLLGDTIEARRVAQRLQVMRDSATSRTFEGAFEPWLTLLEAGPAFQRGDWPTVLKTLSPMATRIHQPRVGYLPGDDYLLWWLMAEAHIRLDDPQSGIRCLESILERPRFRRKNWMLQGYIHPAARFKLAGLYAQVGNAGMAREHYEIFLDTFTDPEPEFEWMVEEARRGLEAAR